ncbi:cupin domain-containing protein [Thermodesulfobacteriota bacterium]
MAQVLNLNELIDFQQDSVVSKTLMEKEVGTVTLFAFDKDQGLSEHTAPFDALVHIIEGEAEVIVSGEAFQLKKGEMIVMPANEPHALKAIDQFKMILIMIRSK